ncbi:MAG: exodeoxyribonuclease V subunit gamma [Cyanobacteria bacterium REEB65]|nr:exodeoxyribonuclease V subunit gamma [Cyanobacteria bacterium REEB65]
MTLLNPSQLQAVEHPGGPLLVLAGAGSGKTRVLTERAALLLSSREVRPWELLAVTFTNKAARELRGRLLTRLVPGADPRHPPRDFSGLWIGTFHSLCARLLRMESASLPYPYGGGFSIFDEDDQLRTIKSVLNDLRIDPKDISPRYALSRISSVKSLSKTPEQMAQEARRPDEDAIAEIYERYQRSLQVQNALDYDDLLLVPARLFAERPEILARWQDRFVHVLVDEYQDTNRAQYHLLRQLADLHRNLTVVGDVDQSVYSFRAADYRIILQFELDYPDAKRIVLEENYRSLQPILDVANAVIAHNLQRYSKTLVGMRQGSEPVRLHCASDERDEANWVVDEIQGCERPYDDFAILYRTHAQSRVLEDALVARGIPYRLVGGPKFFDRKEIRDVVAYLRLLVNPRDDAAFARVVNVPRRGIGAATLDRLRASAVAAGTGLLGAIAQESLNGVGSGAARKLVEFADLLAELTRASEGKSPDQVVDLVLERTGYRACLAEDTDPDAAARLENVLELKTLAEVLYELGDIATLEEFLQRLPLQGAEDDSASLEREVPDWGKTGRDGKVTLMTLHSAKGLEFPVVFLTGLEEGVFPHQRSVDDSNALEEERRLCYVGITRAQDRLYLSHAERRHLAGSARYNLPSRFLGEMPQTHLARSESPLLMRHIRARAARADLEAAVRWSDDAEPFEAQTLWSSSRQVNRLRRSPDETEALAWTQDFDAEPARPAPVEFSVGDRVSHAILGRGEVVQVVPDRRGQCTVVVDFQTAGLKELDPAFSKLTKL